MTSFTKSHQHYQRSPLVLKLPLIAQKATNLQYSSKQHDKVENLVLRLPNLATDPILNNLTLKDILNLRLVSKTLNNWVKDFCGLSKLLKPFRVKLTHEDLKHLLDSGLTFSHFDLHLKDFNENEFISQFLKTFGISSLDSLTIQNSYGFECQEEVDFLLAFKGLKSLELGCIHFSERGEIPQEFEIPWTLDTIFENLKVLRFNALQYDITPELEEEYFTINNKSHHPAYFYKVLNRCKNLKFLKVPQIIFKNKNDINLATGLISEPYLGISIVLQETINYFVQNQRQMKPIRNLIYLDLSNIYIQETSQNLINSPRLQTTIRNLFRLYSDHKANNLSLPPPLILNFDLNLLNYVGNDAPESLNPLTNNIISLKLLNLNNAVKQLHFDHLEKLNLPLSHCFIVQGEPVNPYQAHLPILEFTWPKLTSLEIIFDNLTSIQHQEETLDRILHFLGHNRFSNQMKITELTLNCGHLSDVEINENFDLFFSLYKSRIWLELQKLTLVGWDPKSRWALHFNFFFQVACKNLKQLLLIYNHKNEDLDSINKETLKLVKNIKIFKTCKLILRSSG